MMHTFVVYVEDEPGVLNRVASLFRRRDFNIDSLDRRPHRDARRLAHDVVVQTDDGRRAADRGAPLQAGQRACRSRTSPTAPAVIRDLALIKVAADRETRGRDHAAGRGLRRARRRRRRRSR